ncbi:MAG: ferredoxin, partial [Tannerella sp.]|nr:ferredoxin [Tannerella sp.]
MLIAIAVLGGIGVVSSVLLYVISKKFEVVEDPLIGQMQAALPGANCGGCGFPGCGGFAAACAKAETLDGLLCPVGGTAVMAKVASILGKEAVASEPTVAVVRCAGSCEARPRVNAYGGV